VFVIAGATVVLIIPYILKKISMFRKLTWVYAAVGILSLAIVAVAGSTSYGAKLSISIAGISVQPSEFVKILFVFFIASMLFEKNDIRQVAITSVFSAAFVLMLVASKDLGGALLYFVTYLAMIYVATRRLSYFVGGLGLMGLAAFAGYKLFSHVQTRVLAWKDPLSVIDDQGYQVSQSLFGIGTGSWFGLGLGQGKPNKIPVVEKDFIFSAIAEEMGGIFAICLLLVCVSCFFMMMNIAMQMRDSFYRLVALGLGTLYAMQVLLTVGGAIKFIPSTGVTLPLVSYGGSSLLSTMIIFGVVEGLYIRKDKETKGGETDAAKKGSANAGKSREGRSNKIE
jgi:cell division protein FtsW (lipid II flippase)